MDKFTNFVIGNISNITFTAMDYFILSMNLFLLFFVQKIVIRTDEETRSSTDYTTKIKVLKVISLLFLIVFFASSFLGKKIGVNWSQSYLTMLSTYLINHWINHLFLVKYGYKAVIDDVERYTDNYISQVLRIATSITAFIILFFLLIQIWDKQSWLESGSALVTLGVLLFTTKDFWLEEVMSSLAIHAKGTLNRGCIVELEDGEYYIILESRFIGTRLRNVKTKIEAIVPNKIFVRNIVKIHTIEKENKNENTKNKEWKPTRHSVEFNIGYDCSYESVNEYFETVMAKSSKKCSYIGTYELNLIKNGDYSVTWEILFHLSNPFHIKKSKDTINLYAFNLQKDFGIDLSTPILHTKTN